MSTTVKVVIGLVALAVVGWAIVAGTNKNPDGILQENTDGESAVDEGAFSGNLFDLTRRGGNQKCTWSVSTDEYEGTGTAYVAGNKFRSDMTGSSQGVAFAAYSISDGEYLYSWSDMAPFGVKMSVAAAEAQQAEAMEGGPAYDPGPSDFNLDYNFDCERWSVDASVFVPPTSVEFSEFNF